LSLQILTLHGYGFVENNQNCDIITWFLSWQNPFPHSTSE
jgi:hypothetical protein